MLPAAARNLQGRIADLDQKSLKQQENLYNVEVSDLTFGMIHPAR